MKRDRVIEPVFCPAVAIGNLLDRLRQPIRPWALDGGDAHILSGEAKVARQHQRGATEHRDVETRLRRNGRLSDLVESVEKLLAVEGGRHAAGPRARRGRRPGSAASRQTRESWWR